MKLLFVILGWIFVALGVIGAVLPVVPTVPFLIGAAFFFSKGSPRLHGWLLSQPHVGPMIRDWETTGVIKPQAKQGATIAIVAMFASTLIFVKTPLWVKGVVAGIGIGVLIFIWTRPSEPRPANPA